MGVFRIEVNNEPITIGNKLPDKVTSLNIIYFPRITVPSEHVPGVKKWFNTLIDKLDCEYVTFNKVLIPKNEIKKIEV